MSDPTRLKAEVRIAETQIRDLAVGLSALVDARIGSPIPGIVSRIDPASEGATVGVDITLEGNKLSFTQSTSFGERTTESKFTGTVEGDAITGTMARGNGGDDHAPEKARGEDRHRNAVRA